MALRGLTGDDLFLVDTHADACRFDNLTAILQLEVVENAPVGVVGGEILNENLCFPVCLKNQTVRVSTLLECLAG